MEQGGNERRMFYFDDAVEPVHGGNGGAAGCRFGYRTINDARTLTYKPHVQPESDVQPPFSFLPSCWYTPLSSPWWLATLLLRFRMCPHLLIRAVV